MSQPTKIKLLLVEDDPVDAESVQRTLRNSPNTGAFEIDLKHVDSLSRGIEAFGADPADVVLLDLSLSDSKGLDTLRTFRQGVPRIPIVIMTGFDDENMALETLQNGAQDYLIKGKSSRDAIERSIRYAISRQDSENKLFLSEEKLRQSKKMEALGCFAGGITHDFNNMLTVIIGFSQMVSDHLEDGHPAHIYLQEILSSARRATQLMRQLLAFGSKQRLEIGSIQLNDFLRESENLFKSTLGENIELVMTLSDPLNLIQGDLNQIGQVVINLVSNALEAMPQGGKLVISTSNYSMSEPLVLSHLNAKAGDYVLLRIKDTGVGMTPSVLDRAFDPFFTTKDSGASSGAGLGLSTVYGIIDQLKGGIHVSSEVGAGTTFCIYIPRANVASPSTRESSPSAMGNVHGSETILLVEDDPALRNLFIKHIENLGYKILAASHGGAALEVGKMYQGKIDLVLTDVVMPILDGPSFVKQLKEARNDFKVLYVSAYTRDKLSNLKAGKDYQFLPKPFTREQLAVTIRNILDKK